MRVSRSDTRAPRSRMRLTLCALATIAVVLGVLLNHNAVSYAKTTVMLSSLSSEKTSTIDLPPGTTSVIINIGTNLEPIMPKPSDGPCALTLAFEPIVHGEIPKHPQLHVVPAAVSDAYDITTMYKYNRNAMSSSLNKPASSSWWNSGKQDLGTKIVPVLPMLALIDSIPNHVRIDFIQTDMQGYDFTALSSAMDELRHRPIKFLKTEVNYGHVRTYQGTRNDICDDWLPLMTLHGYSLLMLQHFDKKAVPGYGSHKEALETCRNQGTATGSVTHTGFNEADALWYLSTESTPSLSLFDYPAVQEAIISSTFQSSDYTACRVAKSGQQ